MDQKLKDPLLSEMNKLKIFGGSKRQQKLFEYLLSQSIAGNSENVSEFAVAMDVFDRPEDFDSTKDSIVRVELYRLRNRLKYYSATSQKYSVEIPKSSWDIIIVDKEKKIKKGNQRIAASKFLSPKALAGLIIATLALAALFFYPRSTPQPDTILIKMHIKVESFDGAIEKDMARRLLSFMQSSFGGTRFVVQTPEDIADIVFSFYISPVQNGHEISLSVYSKDGKLISSNIYPYDSSRQSLFEVGQSIFENEVGRTGFYPKPEAIECLVIKVDTAKEARDSLDCLNANMPVLDSDKVYFHIAKADVLTQIEARKYDVGPADPLEAAAVELKKAEDIAYDLPYYYYMIHLRALYQTDDFRTPDFQNELEKFHSNYKENLEAKYLYSSYRFELFGDIKAAEDVETYLDKYYPHRPLFIRAVAMDVRMFHKDWAGAKRNANLTASLRYRTHAFTTLACGSGDENMQKEAAVLLKEKGLDNLEDFAADIEAKNWHPDYKKTILAMDVLEDCSAFTSNQ